MYELELFYMMAITFTIVLAMTIMTFICHSSLVLTGLTKHRFILTFAILGLASIFDLADILFMYYEAGNLAWLSYITNFFYFAFAPLVPILLSRIIYSGKNSWIALLTYGIYFVILLVLVPCQQVFTIDAMGQYHRVSGGFYFFVSAYILSILYLLIVTIILSRQLLSTNPYVLFILFVILLSGTTAQILFQQVYFQFLVISVTTLIFYNYVSSLFSQMDGLTGLFNQYSFLKCIKNIKEGMAIIVMDADDFKQVNDKYGHLIGDEVLKCIAKDIQASFGKSGECYRYGGDEFTAIIKKDANIDELIAKFKTLRQNRIDEGQVSANVSLGYEIYKKGTNVADFENAADKKMYINKARNKKKKL